MAIKSLNYAKFEGISQEMARDKKIVFFHENAAVAGGETMASYKGLPTIDLCKQIGKPRVMVDGISENWYTGAALGASITGLRGIAHHSSGFLAPIWYHQIRELPLLYSSSEGDCKFPVVICQAMASQGDAGAGTYSGNYDFDSLYMRIPCLKVVVPTTAYDAKGMMIASIRTDDPVVYLTCDALKNVTGEVPDELYEVPIGKATIRQEGKDVTIVTSGTGVAECDIAVDTLKKEGISVEYIDLRTLRPLDRKTFVESVRKAGELLTVDHGYFTLCPGAEVIATCAQGVPGARFRRIAFPDVTACSASEFGKYYTVKPDQIVLVAKKLMSQVVGTR